MASNQFRQIPGVDKLLAEQGMHSLKGMLPHDSLVQIVRDYLDGLRASITGGASCPTIKQMIAAILLEAESLSSLNLTGVINASGVILHTNMGRAPLSDDAMSAIQAAARGYSNLEFSLDTGKRSTRYGHVEKLICRLTGAEAAHVVNNNASAVMLALSALAKRKEVIVSRGQAVEIGGKFRVPDVMKQSGAKLKEVGTTNRTYISDYEEAVSEKTAALLRVHRSNFMTVGFTHDVQLAEMVELASSRGITLIDDLGSGCLIDASQYGLTYEPTVQDSVGAGADVICFSGDKLLGGPQAGIIVGKKVLIDKLKNHPLSRAIRIDKLCLAGLAATLVHYLKGEAAQKIPLWCMISTPLSDLETRATKWANVLGENTTIIDGVSTIGAGSIPGSTLPTKLLAVKPDSKQRLTTMVHLLRTRAPHIIGRIEKDTLLLDPRTVLPGEDDLIVSALQSVR
ncbi:MAG: L-seryl-tRNA(Sec) selenium transferase [Chloroflexi bacterium]|jgi:L-seryl-tRNA(Ser) seleniumtransferase|nr:L-seryl-tRNA(Sec) selenium transferase [Chloroflexota bacterium]MBT7080751.1 L-seryl-tRNA(Sec) selenium transferase [Chloroflexota bacterium]MBT7290167.1 L-seryl-tRNA(Sec) selenium transferase [Chloroflexota bacterium]